MPSVKFSFKAAGISVPTPAAASQSKEVYVPQPAPTESVARPISEVEKVTDVDADIAVSAGGEKDEEEDSTIMDALMEEFLVPTEIQPLSYTSAVDLAGSTTMANDLDFVSIATSYTDPHPPTLIEPLPVPSTVSDSSPMRIDPIPAVEQIAAPSSSRGVTPPSPGLTIPLDSPEPELMLPIHDPCSTSPAPTGEPLVNENLVDAPSSIFVETVSSALSLPPSPSPPPPRPISPAPAIVDFSKPDSPVMEIDDQLAPPPVLDPSPPSPSNVISPPIPSLPSRRSPPSSTTSSNTSASVSTAITNPPLCPPSPACSSDLSSLSSDDEGVEDESATADSTTLTASSSALPIPKLPPALIRSTPHSYQPLDLPESFLRTKVDPLAELAEDDDYSYSATDAQMAEFKRIEEEKIEAEREKKRAASWALRKRRLDKGKGKEVADPAEENAIWVYQQRWAPAGPAPPARPVAGPTRAAWPKPSHVASGSAPMGRIPSNASSSAPAQLKGPPKATVPKKRPRTADGDEEMDDAAAEAERLKEIEREKRRARDRRAAEAKRAAKLPQRNKAPTVFTEALDAASLLPDRPNQSTPHLPPISSTSSAKYLAEQSSYKDLLSLPESYIISRARSSPLSSLSPLSSPEPFDGLENGDFASAPKRKAKAFKEKVKDEDQEWSVGGASKLKAKKKKLKVAA